MVNLLINQIYLSVNTIFDFVRKNKTHCIKQRQTFFDEGKKESFIIDLSGAPPHLEIFTSWYNPEKVNPLYQWNVEAKNPLAKIVSLTHKRYI